MENTNENVVKHIHVGGIEATVWKNVNGGKEFLSVSLKRNYKDRNGEWKTSIELIDELAQLLKQGIIDLPTYQANLTMINQGNGIKKPEPPGYS